MIGDASPLMMAGVLIATLASFTLSASAGLGGSLILVPSLALLLGTKEGVALAALLLGANNITKVIAYRRTLPFRATTVVVILLLVGAVLGATALTHAPEPVVGIAVIAAFVITLVGEVRVNRRLRSVSAPFLAFASGATSGFSGTSGPLKGAALRNLDLDRLHFVGGASLASLVGDLGKTAVFAEASLLGAPALRTLAMSIPLMVLGTYLGTRINASIGRKGFAVLFWSVMTGYTIRIGSVLL